jgi:hypothetical protein
LAGALAFIEGGLGSVFCCDCCEQAASAAANNTAAAPHEAALIT